MYPVPPVMNTSCVVGIVFPVIVLSMFNTGGG
jgi:hypothetical protein